VLLAVGCSAGGPGPGSGSGAPLDTSTPDGEAPHVGEAEQVRLDAVRGRLDNPLRGDASLEVVDALHAGELTLRSGDALDVADGVPWGGWEEGTTTSELRLLHSLLIVHDLVEVGRTEDLDRAVELVRDWAAANPREAPADPMAWHDETTARRTSALVRLHDGLAEREAEDPDGQRRAGLRELIADHLALLLDDDFHSTGTNHGMFQDRAALAAAEYLRLREGASQLTDRGWTIARERLLDYYRDFVSGDGVHLEHAPAYHQLIAAAARRDGGFFADLGDEEAAEVLADLHAGMVGYATHVIQPDGTWPLVSDTFGDDAPQVSLWDDPGYRYAATGGAEGRAPDELAVVYEDADYVIMRDRWTDDGRATYLHFTAAYHTDYHKHADDLSVWLYHDGPLLTELGPQGYTMSDPLVQCAFSADAHNIATVAGLELPRTDDRKGDTGLLDVDLSGPVWSASGVNERLDGARLERRVDYDPSAGVVEVTDLIETVEPRAVRLRWHLDPSVTADLEGETLTLVREGLDDVVGTITSDGELTGALLRDDAERCAGLRFGGGEPEPTTTVEFTTARQRRTEIVSRFELTR
jgi:hypothetical protein